tara:strand:+ start:90 stop:290 length:201 start_codon:yes stop_codon:yes gene_type:complete
MKIQILLLKRVLLELTGNRLIVYALLSDYDNRKTIVNKIEKGIHPREIAKQIYDKDTKEAFEDMGY